MRYATGVGQFGVGHVGSLVEGVHEGVSFGFDDWWSQEDGPGLVPWDELHLHMGATVYVAEGGLHGGSAALDGEVIHGVGSDE